MLKIKLGNSHQKILRLFRYYVINNENKGFVVNYINFNGDLYNLGPVEDDFPTLRKAILDEDLPKISKLVNNFVN